MSLLSMNVSIDGKQNSDTDNILNTERSVEKHVSAKSIRDEPSFRAGYAFFLRKRNAIKALGVVGFLGLTSMGLCKALDDDRGFDSIEQSFEKEDNDEISSEWDRDPEYMRVIPGGEFSAEEYKKRVKTLDNGEVIFEDIGHLVFYKVQEGDDIQKIKTRLAKYPRFAYLSSMSLLKQKSFNIPKKSLKKNMWIPIPLDAEVRALTDLEFFNYADKGINEMLDNEYYGSAVKKILDKAGRSSFLASIYAVARQESGGAPIGQFELHRWEPNGHDVFSFSLFHVMMEGPGIRGRRYLNLTEGQCYHPLNGVKLFIAYLCEKTGGAGKCSPQKFFPLNDNLDSFAAFYNGRAWKKRNPHYAKDIDKYYSEGEKFLAELDRRGLSLREALEIEASGGSAHGGGVEFLSGVDNDTVNALKKRCVVKFTPGRCTVDSGSYKQNERMLGIVNAQGDDLTEDQTAKLREYYCGKLTGFLDKQDRGELPRPRGDWAVIAKERRRKLKEACEK